MALLNWYLSIFIREYRMQKIYRKLGYLEFTFVSLWLTLIFVVGDIVAVFLYFLFEENKQEIFFSSITYIALASSLFHGLFYHFKKEEIESLKEMKFDRTDHTKTYRMISTFFSLAMIALAYLLIEVL